MSTILHHDADSLQFAWAKYNPETEEFYAGFHNGGAYVYSGVPAKIWDDLLTAKSSTPEATETTRGPIGDEKAGSEGSYFIHHVKGKNWKDASPFPYRRLTQEEIDALTVKKDTITNSEDLGDAGF